jgi:hypothetical protein
MLMFGVPTMFTIVSPRSINVFSFVTTAGLFIVCLCCGHPTVRIVLGSVCVRQRNGVWVCLCITVTSSPVQSTAVSCGDSSVDTALSTSGAHAVDDSVTVSGGSHKPNPLDTSESSSSLKRAAIQQPADGDDSMNAPSGVTSGQLVEERIGELVLKQGVLERWLKVFVDESALKRESERSVGERRESSIGSV